MPKEISKIPKIPKWSHHPTSKNPNFVRYFEKWLSQIYILELWKMASSCPHFYFTRFEGQEIQDFSGAPPGNDRTHILSRGQKLFFRGCKCSVFRPNFWTEFLLALSMLLATTQRHVPTSDFDPILRVPSLTTKSGHLSIYSACPLLVYGLHRKYFPTKLGKKWFRSK